MGGLGALIRSGSRRGRVSCRCFIPSFSHSPAHHSSAPFFPCLFGALGWVGICRRKEWVTGFPHAHKANGRSWSLDLAWFAQRAEKKRNYIVSYCAIIICNFEKNKSCLFSASLRACARKSASRPPTKSPRKPLYLWLAFRRGSWRNGARSGRLAHKR